MSRVLITTWDGGGNVPPALNLGVRLSRRGHEVLVVGWEAMAGRVAAAGLAFRPCPSVPAWPHELSFEDDMDRLETMLHDARAERDIVATGAAFRPDVVVVDAMMAAAFRAAARLDRPAAVLGHLLYQRYAAGIGRIAPGADLDNVATVLALTPPGFDFDGPLPPNTRYVGPILHPDAPPTLAELGLTRLAEPGDRWVLLSLSTTQMRQARVLPTLLDALGSLPIRVLVTLADVVAPDDLTLPANATARGLVPHAAVLPFMAAVVTHGGLSTITAALAYGVPQVVIPQGRDQHRNAERVAACGTGRVIPPGASATVVAEAVADTASDPAAVAASRDFAHTIADLGHGARATKEVADLTVRTPAAAATS